MTRQRLARDIQSLAACSAATHITITLEPQAAFRLADDLCWCDRSREPAELKAVVSGRVASAQAKSIDIVFREAQAVLQSLLSAARQSGGRYASDDLAGQVLRDVDRLSSDLHVLRSHLIGKE